jgi:hypothetical protein
MRGSRSTGAEVRRSWIKSYSDLFHDTCQQLEENYYGTPIVQPVSSCSLYFIMYANAQNTEIPNCVPFFCLNYSIKYYNYIGIIQKPMVIKEHPKAFIVNMGVQDLMVEFHVK